MASTKSVPGMILTPILACTSVALSVDDPLVSFDPHRRGCLRETSRVGFEEAGGNAPELLYDSLSLQFRVL